MGESLRYRLIVGPILVGLLAVVALWAFLRPELNAALETAQRDELRAQLSILSRTAPVSPGIPFTAEPWRRWLGGIDPSHRLTVIGFDGKLLADSASPSPDQQLLDASIEAVGEEWAGTRRRPDGGLESYVMTRLPIEGRAVLVRLAAAEHATADSAHLTWLATGLTLMAMLLGALLTFFDLSRVVITLGESRGLLKELRRRNFKPRLAVEGPRELRLLALELNKLARMLEVEMADLEGARSRLWGVLDGMAEGVLVTDRHDDIVLANRALTRILRFQGAAVGRRPLELVRSPELAEAMEHARQSREPVSVDLELRFPEPRFVTVRIARWGDELSPVGLVAVMHDVTETRRLEQVRRDFVANASHELRTPVAAIRGYAEALLDGDPLPEEARNFVSVIERNARRLGALVDDILSLARIESPTYRPVMEAVDLLDVVGTVVRGVDSLAQERHIRVTPHLEPGFPAAWADRKAVEHVLTNLIENALKYTPPGGRCDIHLRQEGEGLVVEVIDTGVGIPPNDLNRIFERFYRVDSARSRAVGGTGLGLAIVKHLVLAMGGEVSVQSTYGMGSTFRVRLRAYQSSPPPEPSATGTDAGISASDGAP